MTEIEVPPSTRDTVAPDGVVVGVDGSPGAVVAAEWAAREAHARGAELTIAYALSLPDVSLVEPSEYALRSRRAGQAVVDGVVTRLRELLPDLRPHTLLSDLPAARALLDLSRHCALVVTGTRGRGGFPGMALGSVSRRLAAHAHCPLVVVPGGRSQGSLNEVAVGVEPGQAAPPLEFAFAAAARHGASLHAVRAWWPSRFRGMAGGFSEDLTRVRDAQATAVDELLGPFKSEYPKVDVGIMAWRGNTVPILIEAARDTRLLVVGAHRHRGPLEVGAGYVIDGVLAHSPTPVAVVPIH